MLMLEEVVLPDSVKKSAIGHSVTADILKRSHCPKTWNLSMQMHSGTVRI